MKKHTELSYANESLLSSLDIQGWNMKTFTEEIYENIGQFLSLAKMQIATINPYEKEEAKQIVESSDQLLNQVIKDLRSLAKQLTPTEIMHRGFIYSLRYELSRLNKSGFWTIELFSHGKTFRLEYMRELILFSIIQHYVLKALYIERAKQVKLKVNFDKDMIEVSIYYPTNSELFTQRRLKKEAGILSRAKLIDAVVSTKKTAGQTFIAISIKKNGV